MNLYQYCWNNPTNWNDPYGLVAEDVINQVVSSPTTYMVVSGGTIIGPAVPVVAGTAGAAVVGGAVGYGVYKFGVEPALDKIGDVLYDLIVNSDNSGKDNDNKQNVDKHADDEDKKKSDKKSKSKSKYKSKVDRNKHDKLRKAQWKKEAQKNPGKYSDDDLKRMKKGKSPIGPDGHPRELHHKDGTMDGGVKPMDRTDHRLGGNYKKNHPWVK